MYHLIKPGQVWRVAGDLYIVTRLTEFDAELSELNDPVSNITVRQRDLQNVGFFQEDYHSKPGFTYFLRSDRSAWVVCKKENGRAYLENPKTKVRMTVPLGNFNFIRLFTGIRSEFQGRRFAISNGPLDDAERERLKTLWGDSYTGGRIKELVESGFLVKPQSLWEKIRAFWSRK